MRFDNKKRLFLVKKYHKLENCTLVQMAWRSEFKNLKAPDKRTILNTVSKVETTSSINSLSPIQLEPSE